MTKNQRLLLGITLLLLFTSIALTTPSASSEVIIYAFDQNPAGSDEGNEWVTFHNPSNESVDIGNWTLETTNGSTVSVWIAECTTLYPGSYCTYTPHYRWLDNSQEAIILRNAKGEEVDRTPVVSDNENDNRYWMRYDIIVHKVFTFSNIRNQFNKIEILEEKKIVKNRLFLERHKRNV